MVENGDPDPARGTQHGKDRGTDDRETLHEIARLIVAADPPANGGRAAPPEHGADGVTAAEGSILARLLDALPAGVALCRDGVLLRANTNFALAFGHRSGAELLAKGGLGAVLPDCAEGFATDSDATRLATARTASGRSFTIPLSVLRVTPDGRLVLLVLHPKAPPQPGAGDAAVEPNAAPAAPPAPAPARPRADFLAKVSHEVRTPLNSIIGFAELMKSERFGPLANPKYREYAQDIYDSGVYALSLINDLLDISKVESGRFELNFTAVETNELIAEAVHLMQPQARAERVVLRAALAEAMPMVLADRRSLKQILLNLLSNAVKFTPAGGQAIVSSTLEPNGEARIRVRDTGVGMTPAEIAQALEPFRQLDTAPRQRAGTGLGLPLTRALVTANRARFEIESEARAGTRVDVIFPKDRVVG